MCFSCLLLQGWRRIHSSSMKRSKGGESKRKGGGGQSQMAQQTVLCVSDKNRSTDVSWRNMNWKPQLCQAPKQNKKPTERDKYTSWDYRIEIYTQSTVRNSLCPLLKQAKIILIKQCWQSKLVVVNNTVTCLHKIKINQLIFYFKMSIFLTFLDPEISWILDPCIRDIDLCAAFLH